MIYNFGFYKLQLIPDLSDKNIVFGVDLFNLSKH